MSDVAMPPNESIGANKNKKKKEKASVQVQPQPQKVPTPPLLADNIENTLNSPQLTEVTLETDDWQKDCDKKSNNENDLSSLGDLLTGTSSPAAVHPPPLRSPSVRSTNIDNNCTKPISPTVGSPGTKPREKVSNIHRGQIVKPRHVPESSLANSMAELVQEAIPSQQPSAALPEKVEWVQFYTIEKAGEMKKKMDILLLGLARGFQLWCSMDSGEYEEVMSERQGPIRAFVPIPNNIKGVFDNTKDLFSTLRPQVALVDAFSPAPEKQYCTVAIISLITKHVHRLPSSTTPYEEPVCGLHCSESFLIVSFSSRALIYETQSYGFAREINISSTIEKNIPPIAINSHLLAYPVDKIDNDIQSCGGLDIDGVEIPDDYASQVIGGAKAFSRTVASLVETVSGSGVTKTKATPKGIITVIDLTKERENSVYAHFIAHMEAISYCCWSPDGRLILTADVTGSCFNIFNVLPHPASPCLGTVQHIYRLHRGNTSAKIASTAFSMDGRWLAVATNHGTTHVFAICPFGGKPSLRTHGSHFTNRESPFLRSAGLTDTTEPYSNGRSRKNSGSVTISREHPYSNKLLARCSQNPRIGPFEPPVLLKAVAKIPDPRISPDNLIAWANDLAPLAISSQGKRPIELPRMSLSINSREINGVTEQFLSVCRAETGVVFQYKLASPRVSLDQPDREPQLDIEPMYMWVLHRTKNDSDIPPPLEQGNSLRSFSCASENLQRYDPAQGWIPQAEIKTYSGPTRRVWQGPQFSFYEYKDDSGLELMAPSDSRQSLNSMKSIPVVIGDKAGKHEDYLAGNSIRIECSSSYGSESVLSTMNIDQNVEDISKKIADAMREDDDDHRSSEKSSLRSDDPFDLE